MAKDLILKATPGQLLLRIQIKGKNRFRIALRQFLSFGNFALIIFLPLICILNNNCPGVALRAIGTIPKISNSE